MANLTNKLLFTHENFERINGVLSDYGYESDVTVTESGSKYGNVSQNRDFVNIRYHNRNGFFIVTSNRQICRDDELEQYQAELQEAGHVLEYLKKNFS